jgi:hypothetical protein
MLKGTSLRALVLALVAVGAFAAGRLWERPAAPPAVAPSAQSRPANPAAPDGGQADQGGAKPSTPEGQLQAAPPSAWVRDLSALLQAAGGLVTLQVLALVAMFVLRKQLVALSDAVVSAIGGDRGVTLDLGKVKVVVTERMQESPEDLRPLYLSSLFDIDGDDSRHSASVFEQPTPQLTFHVSDYVAEFWELHKGGGAAADQMRADRDELRRQCGHGAVTLAGLRPALDTYVRSLEASRFREAHQFADLLDECAVLREGLAALMPRDLGKDEKDFRVLHAAGVAFAQRG